MAQEVKQQYGVGHTKNEYGSFFNDFKDTLFVKVE